MSKPHHPFRETARNLCVRFITGTALLALAATVTIPLGSAAYFAYMVCVRGEKILIPMETGALQAPHPEIAMRKTYNSVFCL